jgi:nicotinamidase/pyrazinamidase
VSKGCDAGRDAYSGFDGTDLAARLRAHGVRRVFVGGVATDYCVRATVKDATAAGFAAVVLPDAVRAIRAEDGTAAEAEMRACGARFLSATELE